MAYIDPNELMYLILSSESGITTNLMFNGQLQLFGPPGLPTNFAPRSAVEWRISPGGEGDMHLPRRTLTYEFRCYGVYPRDATDVFDLIYAALHRKSHTKVVTSRGDAQVLYCRLVSDAGSMVEPQTDWNFVLCSFELQLIDVSVD